MKKLLFALFVLAATVGWGQTIHSTFPVTVAWDAAATATSYEVYRVDAVGATLLAEVAGTQYVVAAVPVGDWVIAVRSVRTVGGSKVFSDFSLSTDVAVTPIPFILRNLAAPGRPGNLRRVL